jgi:hypothetical protein
MPFPKMILDFKEKPLITHDQPKQEESSILLFVLETIAVSNFLVMLA